jgi:hypothetical protein
MRIRILQIGLIALGLLSCGCGGQLSDSFANSVYINIQGTGGLQPNAIVVPNNYRIVFINNDGIAHTVNWQTPLNLSAVAPANGGRAWFELPVILPGTVLNYHLDGSGAAGSVTVVSAV